MVMMFVIMKVVKYLAVVYNDGGCHDNDINYSYNNNSYGVENAMVIVLMAIMMLVGVMVMYKMLTSVFFHSDGIFFTNLINSSFAHLCLSA